MDHEDPSQSAQNSGQNAARAVARIPGQSTVVELTRLAKEGGKFGRRNVARCIGWRGDPSLMPILRELAASDDSTIQREALLAAGAVGGTEAPELLRPFLVDTNLELSAAAIRSAARIGDVTAAGVLEERLRAELRAERAEERMLGPLLEYFTALPHPALFDALNQALRAAEIPIATRLAALEALTALAKSHPTESDRVIETLRWATKCGIKSLVNAAALGMLELGDPSGVDDVTADLTDDLLRNKNNFNARYRRGEIYLDFGRFKDAQKDFSEGLRVEKDPRDPERVYIGLARAYAGMGRFADAVKYLRKLPDRDFSDLPTKFPEFRELVNDPRYGTILKPR